MNDTYQLVPLLRRTRPAWPSPFVSIDAETREIVTTLASTTDDFWSDDLVELLATGALPVPAAGSGG